MGPSKCFLGIRTRLQIVAFRVEAVLRHAWRVLRQEAVVTREARYVISDLTQLNLRLVARVDGNADLELAPCRYRRAPVAALDDPDIHVDRMIEILEATM